MAAAKARNARIPSVPAPAGEAKRCSWKRAQFTTESLVMCKAPFAHDFIDDLNLTNEIRS
jgi:hypothetical protein